MRNLVLCIIALGLGLVGTAHAVTLQSPPLSRPPSGNLRCWASNVTPNKDRRIQVEMLRRDGPVIATRHCAVGAFESCFVDATNASAAYCRVTTPGGRASVRASIEARIGGSPVASLPAQ